MNKEEILEKSRKENNGQDIYEQQVIQKGGSIGTIVAMILATVFFVTQIVLGEGQNYGLYAIIGSILATGFIVKAVYLKRKHEIAVAAIYTLLTIACTVAHIMQLIQTSTIL